MAKRHPAGTDYDPAATEHQSTEERTRGGARQPDWADEAARARTGDDPRAAAPHDRTGKPSTGDRR
jgi:hypothetical protein